MDTQRTTASRIGQPRGRRDRGPSPIQPLARFVRLALRFIEVVAAVSRRSDPSPPRRLWSSLERPRLAPIRVADATATTGRPPPRMIASRR